MHMYVIQTKSKKSTKVCAIVSLKYKDELLDVAVTHELDPMANAKLNDDGQTCLIDLRRYCDNLS